MPNARMTRQAVDTAQAAIDLNMSRLRLEDTDNRQTGLFHLLISLIEWCDFHGVDFDASVSEVRQYYVETEARAE